MKRWMIAGVAVVGVALGVLLMPRPNTGGDVGERAGVKLDGTAFVVPNDPDARNTDPGAVPGEVAPVAPGDGAVTDRGQLSEAEMAAIRAKLSTPEANASRLVGTGWAKIRMELKNLGDADAMALAAEIEALQGDLRQMQRGASKEGWDALEVRQRDLLARIAQRSDANGAELAEGVAVVNQRLTEYNDGTLPISTVGPTAGGATRGASGGENEVVKVRPQ